MVGGRDGRIWGSRFFHPSLLFIFISVAVPGGGGVVHPPSVFPFSQLRSMDLTALLTSNMPG